MAEENTGAAGTGGSEMMPAPGVLRASHADRDRVVETLRSAAGDGRLSAEELDERLELALTARTYAELATLTTDLPATGQADLVPATGTGLAVGEQAKELAKIQVGSGQAKR